MAEAIRKLTQNAVSGSAILSGMDGYDIDEDAAKIRIQYSQYLG